MTSSKHAGDDASISPVRQAGAVAFRSDKGSGIEILLVRPSSGLKEWGFPKGHLEGDESVEQCALRELLEETGVKGRLVGGIDHISRFEHGGLKKAVRYFAVEWTADGSATEDRETLWLPMALAAEALTHQDNRLVLEGAAPVIHAHLAVTCLDGVRRFDDFMLAELGHVTESLFKSEEDGERRVVFFLTLAAGAGALLAFLLGKDATYLPGKQNPPAIMVFAARSKSVV